MKCCLHWGTRESSKRRTLVKHVSLDLRVARRGEERRDVARLIHIGLLMRMTTVASVWGLREQAWITKWHIVHEGRSTGRAEDRRPHLWRRNFPLALWRQHKWTWWFHESVWGLSLGRILLGGRRSSPGGMWLLLGLNVAWWELERCSTIWSRKEVSGHRSIRLLNVRIVETA
jgi:hypothetical protein